MNLFPQATGIRPRLACELSPSGVVAARADSAGAPLSAVTRVTLREGAVQPSLKPGNLVDRVAVIAAMRRAIEDTGVRANSRGADLTLIVPDAAVRVLLLDFDSLPNKLTEALPIVRFRLKKLLPFDADDAVISYQIMSTSRSMVRVLAIAIPRDVLAEYETAAREAGYEPGAVLPSTVAAIAGLDDSAAEAALVVNANPAGVTTAIVRSGILLLHRSVDLQPAATAGTPANMPPALFERGDRTGSAGLPLVSAEDTASEWAAQQPLPEHGRSPYATAAAGAEEAVQAEDNITGYPVPDIYASAPATAAGTGRTGEPAPIQRSPLASPSLLSDLNAETHNAILVTPGAMIDFAADALQNVGREVDETHSAVARSASLPPLPPPPAGEGVEPITIAQDSMGAFAAEALYAVAGARAAAQDPAAAGLGSATQSSGATGHSYDIAEAVSVAAAYYEDTLASAPTRILSAGSLGAEGLARILQEEGVGDPRTLQVRELVDAAAVAAPTSVPRGWLAGVLGGLRG